MRVSSLKTRPATSRCLLLCLAVPMMVLLMNACAIQKPLYHFQTKAISRITYNPKNCVEQPDGRFKCKDVVFTVTAIEPMK